MGLTTARVAILADRFRLSMAEIGRLTDRTIHEVYFHKRTKEGAIDIPMPTLSSTREETLESALADLEVLKSLLTQENYEETKAAVVERFRGKVQES